MEISKLRCFISFSKYNHLNILYHTIDVHLSTRIKVERSNLGYFSKPFVPLSDKKARPEALLFYRWGASFFSIYVCVSVKVSTFSSSCSNQIKSVPTCSCLLIVNDNIVLCINFPSFFSQPIFYFNLDLLHSRTHSSIPIYPT